MRTKRNVGFFTLGMAGVVVSALAFSPAVYAGRPTPEQIAAFHSCVQSAGLPALPEPGPSGDRQARWAAMKSYMHGLSHAQKQQFRACRKSAFKKAGQPPAAPIDSNQ